MENNLENKAKFFAQYWGQRVLRFDTWTKNAERKEVGSFISDLYNNKCIIELKPLSSISDEDKEYLDALQASSFDEYGYWFGMGGVHYYQPHEVDYLRSRGYALPFMGVTVEYQIKYGWIKLKGETK